jgi:poly(A) polymerase/tRNA nucleotidyltransferase (CCA-adding enzyme)
VELDFKIEKKTFEAIKENAKNLNHISAERIKDEFQKIILSPMPAKGIDFLHETGLLQYIIPEIEIGIDVTQSHHHYYGPYNTVYKHLLASLEKCPSEKLEVRLAALLHDIGKPKTKHGRGENATFHNHEYAGAKIAEKILLRLRFPKKIIDKAVLLIRNHMFYYNVDEVGESGVRRVIRKVGLENIGDLIDVRIADRLGSGVPKAVPYKLRHFKFMVEKVSHDAISVKQLKINGTDLMNELKISPGPKIGAILDVLLSEAIESPELNDKNALIKRARELDKMDIGKIREMAKKKIAEEKKEEEKLMKKKYWVE